MKILVFGSTGQVATDLRRQAPKEVEIIAVGRDRADFNDPAACVAVIAQVAPDAIINAVAYTAVDAAETDAAQAMTINATTPGEIAKEAAARAIPLVHISTDYVFDGTGNTPWPVEAATAPLGVYGRSKALGEQAVRAAKGQHAILRTSWVFSAHGGNFVKTMLRLGHARDHLGIVCDQIGGPTAAADIARTCLGMAQAMVGDRALGGTYHFSGAPDTSWAGFAREIFAQAGLDVAVEDIATADYPTPAARPANSRLDGSTLERDFGILRPDWRQSLAAVLADLGETR